MGVAIDHDTSDIDYSTPAELPDDDNDILERVAWHARMARRAQAELDEISDLYDAELARLTERRENRVRIIMERLAWHKAPIESYARMRLERDGKRTIELPHATSKISVPTKPQVFITDTDTLTDWARTRHPEILRSPNVTDVRRVVTVTDDGKVVDPDTGEFVPGVEAQVPQPRWSIDLEPGSPW